MICHSSVLLFFVPSVGQEVNFDVRVPWSPVILRRKFFSSEDRDDQLVTHFIVPQLHLREKEFRIQSSTSICSTKRRHLGRCSVLIIPISGTSRNKTKEKPSHLNANPKKYGKTAPTMEMTSDVSTGLRSTPSIPGSATETSTLQPTLAQSFLTFSRCSNLFALLIGRLVDLFNSKSSVGGATHVPSESPVC